VVDTANVLAANVDTPSETVSVLLVLVALAYWDVAAWVAVKLTSPALTSVIQFPDASIVATPVLLLLYVIAPLLLLVGRAMMLNDASPYVFVVATENVLAERLDVPRATVSVLLVLVALVYWDVAAWVALKLTSPAPTRVIKVPDASIVATPVLLLLYVIAPLLLLVGRVVILNDASPYIFVSATENVLAERLDVPRATVSVVVMVPSQYVLPFTGCVAVITLDPPDNIVTVEPDIVATDGVPDEYENAVELLDEGSVRLNEASPYVFPGIETHVMVGTIGSGNPSDIKPSSL
jgi:hypothetical protein